MKFDVILIDPPWKFRVWNKDTGHGRSAESHYNTMDIDELKNLKINELANDNCALFIWCVWPSIFEYPNELFDAWGFKYKTLGFEWLKLKKHWIKYYIPMMPVIGKHDLLYDLFHFGMGYYTRANSEPCLLAVKGSMPVSVKNERNFIIAPVQKHSQKPNEQYDKIEALYPNMKYLEVFAREKRNGWYCIGNGVSGLDINKEIELLIKE